jgi:hypothetical protein
MMLVVYLVERSLPIRGTTPDLLQSSLMINTIKELMSYPECRSVEVINNPARPGLNHREVNCINYS